MANLWYGYPREAKRLGLDEEEMAYSFLQWYAGAHQKGYSAEYIDESELKELYPAFRSWLFYKSTQYWDNQNVTVERMSEYVLHLERIIKAANLGHELPLSRRDVWRWYWRVFIGIVRRDHLSSRRLGFAKDYCSLPRGIRWKFRRFRIWYEFQVQFWMGYGKRGSRMYYNGMVGYLRRYVHNARMKSIRREIAKWRKAYGAASERWKDRLRPRS